MKRPFLFFSLPTAGLLTSGAALIAVSYGLVRLAYGLFLPDVQAELAFDAAAAGLISSAASVVYCLGAIVGFFVAARHPRGLVVAAALIAGLGTAGMAVAIHPATFATCAIVSSAGAGVASPGLVSIIRRNVTHEANDRAQATVNAGVGPGLVGAGVLALILLPNWRLAWLIVAGLTPVIGAAVLLSDRHREPTREGAGDRPSIPPGSWFRAHRQIILAAFLMGAGSAAVWNYGRTDLVNSGASGHASVVAWIALGLGGTAVIATARLLSILDPRTAWTITTLTIAAATTTLGLVPNTTAAALAACGAFGWGYTAGTGVLIAWTTRIDTARAAAGTSLLFVTLFLGQAVGATTIGALISSSGFVVAFISAAVTILAAVAAPFWCRTTGRQPEFVPCQSLSGQRLTGS